MKTLTPFLIKINIFYINKIDINNNTEKYSEVVGSSLNNYLNGFASAAQEFSSGLSSAVNSLSTTLEETKNAANIMSTSLEAYIKNQDVNKRVTK